MAWLCAGILVDGGSSEAVSPVVHVRLAEQPGDASQAEQALQQVVDAALRKSGVLMAVNRLSKLDAVKAAPSIRWEGKACSLTNKGMRPGVSIHELLLGLELTRCQAL